MSECPHYRSTDARYHTPLGPKGIDCCLRCFVTINPPNDIAVFTTLNHAFFEQRIHNSLEAEWLLAEKDYEIAGLRETIEMLEVD